MKARLVTRTENGITYDALYFVCPGCLAAEGPGTGLHCLPVNSETKSPQWTWNGDLENPTLSPSILSQGRVRCHSFLEDGKFRFLPDSEHSLSGQTGVPMPDLPDWVEELSEDDEEQTET